MRNTSVIVATLLLSGISLMDAQTPARTVSQAGQLSTVQGMIDKGQADRALKDIQASLLRYNTTDLPTALWLSGKARLALAQNADAAAKGKLYLQAALDFMKVATFFPYANEAPPASVEAGKALAAAGDKASARVVLESTLMKFADSDVLPEARKALDKLK